MIIYHNKYYYYYYHRYPLGYITMQQFKELYERTHPGTDAEELAQHIYRLFDGNNDNQVSFKEFMMAVSVSCRGTMR